MSLYETGARLERAEKDLDLAWRRASEQWRDARSHALEKELLDPLKTASKQAADAVTRLQQAVQQARRDCS